MGRGIVVRNKWVWAVVLAGVAVFMYGAIFLRLSG